MVVGSGMLARAFRAFDQDDRWVFFASGVSDSHEHRVTEFARERELLLKTIRENHERRIIYFSTCGLTDDSVNDRPYYLHKAEMERVVVAHASKHAIFRLSHVVGPGGNPKTVLNYLVDKVRRGEEFTLWSSAERNLIDVDDVVEIVKQLLEKGDLDRPISIANTKNIGVPDLVAQIESSLARKANYIRINAGEELSIDTGVMESICSGMERFEAPGYIPSLIKKYHVAP